MVQKVKERVKIEDILMAHNCMKDIVIKTPLQRDTVLSEKYDCDVYVKREDLQLIRSFKIRGAYNLIQSLPKVQLQNGVVCASAGNHAQGVAYTCNLLKIPSKIFMPTTTPKQKVSQVQFFGGDFAEIVLVGDTFETCKDVIDDIVLVPEGKVCTTILELYKKNAIVAEPAGALSIAALDLYRDEIKGKTVVCTLSGGNNDIDRMQEMKERSLIYEGLKHYFIIEFPQRSGALREFLDKGLGPEDDITRFEYIKKHNKENGPALVGVELKHKEDYEQLITRFKENNIQFMELNKNPVLFDLLI